MEYIGNCKDFILDSLISEIKNFSSDIGDVRPKEIDLNQKYKSEIMQKLLLAGYSLSKMRWTLYYQSHLSTIFQLPPIFKNVKNWWFVKLNPGDIFPYHLDVYDDQKILDRYWIACEDHKPGHIFSYGNDVLTGYQAGDIFKFDAHRIYHGAANIGFEPKISLQVSCWNDTLD